MIPITRPTLPDAAKLQKDFQKIFDSGILTNGTFVERLENEIASYLGVRHVVAVSSCTAGLMLSHQALGLTGEVILPSFTFSATAHSLTWNNLSLNLVDSDPFSFNIVPELVEAKITPKTSAILAVDIFGNPCDRDTLKKIATGYGLKLVIDSAHGMGSLYEGGSLGGWGDAEVFSLSPTKVMVAGEGGFIAVSDSVLAEKLKRARNYGDCGNYNCEFAGFNARMSEFHAAVALRSLEMLESNVVRRNKLAELYKEELGDIDGIRFQEIRPTDRSSYKDFALYISPKVKITRDLLMEELAKKGIQTKPYFNPPIHKMAAYQPRRRSSDRLEEAEMLSENCICIPLYSHMPEEELEFVAKNIKQLLTH